MIINLPRKPGWYRWSVSSTHDYPVYCQLQSQDGTIETLQAKPRRSSSRVLRISGNEKENIYGYADEARVSNLSHTFKKINVLSAYSSMLFRVANTTPHRENYRLPSLIWNLIRGVFNNTSPSNGLQKKYCHSHFHSIKDNKNIKDLIEKNSIPENKELIKTQPLVSIIIPTKDNFEILKNCIDSLQKYTKNENIEILLVDNQTSCQDSLDFMGKTEANNRNIKILKWPKVFNYSAINNYAASQSKGEYLLFLNNDTEAVQHNWLSQMLSLATQPRIGCVGAALFYPNGRLQHAGVALGIGGIAGHVLRYFPRQHQISKQLLSKPRYVSAVTGACMLVKRSLFEEISGFDEVSFPVKYNDIDLCLRLQRLGKKNAFTPKAGLIHHESISRQATISSYKKSLKRTEESKMLKYWWAEIQNDPHYSEAFSRIYEDLSPTHSAK